jgi:hypothetical protein
VSADVHVRALRSLCSVYLSLVIQHRDDASSTSSHGHSLLCADITDAVYSATAWIDDMVRVMHILEF